MRAIDCIKFAFSVSSIAPFFVTYALGGGPGSNLLDTVNSEPFEKSQISTAVDSLGRLFKVSFDLPGPDGTNKPIEVRNQLVFSKNGCQFVLKIDAPFETPFGNFEKFDLTSTSFSLVDIPPPPPSLNLKVPPMLGFHTMQGNQGGTFSFTLNHENERASFINQLGRLRKFCLKEKQEGRLGEASFDPETAKLVDELSKKKEEKEQREVKMVVDSVSNLLMSLKSQPEGSKSCPNFTMFSLDPEYEGEDSGNSRAIGPNAKTKYLSETELEETRSIIKDGKLIFAKRAKLVDGDFIYVVAPDGELYINSKDIVAKERFHHSSFLSGTAVVSAGHIKVSNGNILSIDNTSGHYKPSNEGLAQVLALLAYKGYNSGDITQIKIKVIALPVGPPARPGSAAKK